MKGFAPYKTSLIPQVVNHFIKQERVTNIFFNKFLIIFFFVLFLKIVVKLTE